MPDCYHEPSDDTARDVSDPGETASPSSSTSSQPGGGWARPGEHPVEAAIRGALPRPPIPRPPSRWLTWGYRAAPLVPAAMAVTALTDLPASRSDAPRAALLACAALALLTLVGLLGWTVGQPRLTSAQHMDLFSGLVRSERRRLRHALVRGEALPADLRPWAEPYVRDFSSGELGGLGLSLGSASMLLSISQYRLGPVYVLLLVVVVGGALMLASVLSLQWWMRRNARRQGLLPDQLADAPADAGADEGALTCDLWRIRRC